MNINLNNDEIMTAIVDYVSSQGISLGGKDVTVNMVAGRGARGYSAEVVIADTALLNVRNNGVEAILMQDSPVQDAVAAGAPAQRNPFENDGANEQG